MNFLINKKILKLVFLILVILSISAHVDNNPPEITSFDATPNPVLLKGKIKFSVEGKDDLGIEKIFLESKDLGILREYDCEGSKICTSEFYEKFTRKGEFEFCSWARNINAIESEKNCLTVLVKTISECEEIKLYDSSQDVVIATKIKTKKLHQKVDNFEGYPLECCPYCQELEINTTNCEIISGSFNEYKVISYPSQNIEIYKDLKFPKNILPGIEKPFILCQAKINEKESVFGIIEGKKFQALDFIYNEEKFNYWLIEKINNDGKDKYFLAEEDISTEKEIKEITIVDSERYSNAVNRLMRYECYHKQPESLECTFDCVYTGEDCNPLQSCAYPCGLVNQCGRDGCCGECQQVYDYEECVYDKYEKLWGRPYTDYLFCYRTPLKDTGWCKQRSLVSTSVINYPWYSFDIKEKGNYTGRDLGRIDQDYINDIHEWNEMQKVKEMPDRSVIQHVTRLPEQECRHQFEPKLFRTVWTKIFTVTPFLNDERNNIQWSRTGEGAVYAGGGFRREPACWWECCRMCAPMCNWDCIPCCNYCNLRAGFTSGVTKIMRFTIPNVDIADGELIIIQDSPTQVTVTNGALTVTSTGNIPFSVTSAIFTKDPSQGIYTLTQVYTPSSRRNQFVVVEDIVFKYDLREEAEMLVVDLDETFTTSLAVRVCRCACSCPGCSGIWGCCPCVPAGVIRLQKTETVVDSLGAPQSMKKIKIDALKDATNLFVDLVIPDIRVGLVSFSDNVISFLPLTTDANALHNEINSYYPRTSTCIGCGVRKGIELLSGVEGEKYIILMSDGIPNRPVSEPIARDYARDAVRAAAAAGIVVHTVAVGDDAVLSFMEELANLGNGRFYAVKCGCLFDCIYKDLAEQVKNAVILVNDISGSMAWPASLECPGTGPPVIHRNILRDIDLSITGRIDSYPKNESFITHRGFLNITVSPDIMNKFILKVKNSTLEYSSLEYPPKHELYRKEYGHGVWQPGYPYTPIDPIPSYGYLPAKQTYKMESSYGYELRTPTAVEFEFPYPEQGKEICPLNCFCPDYDLTDVTCVDYKETPPKRYKRTDCICAEKDQSFLRPIYSTKTFHDEEFYYYDFVDLYTKERDELKLMSQQYKEKPISTIGGSLSGNVTHILERGNITENKSCVDVKPEDWDISSNAIIIPTDPENANSDAKQKEPLRVHGLAWRLASCSLNTEDCDISEKFKIGRIIGPITFLGKKYNAGPYVVVSSSDPKAIVEKVISKYNDFRNVDYYPAGSTGRAKTRQIFPLRICIQDGSYDQPSHLFNEMLIPFSPWSRDCLTDADVIIFGCPAGPAEREEIRQFVSKCGTYIGTDWNYDHLQGIFPGYFTASKSGSGSADIWEGSQRGTYDLSDDLKEFFQTPYESMSGWHLLGGTIVIDSIDNPETKVLAKGNYASGQQDKPMAVTFKYGSGRVFYYTIHIEGAASSSEKVFMASFYSSVGSIQRTEKEAVGYGTYLLNFTAIQFPEQLTKEDFENAEITVFIHFRNNTRTQTYPLFPKREETTPPKDKKFSTDIKIRDATKLIIEKVEPGRYNLNPGTTDVKVIVKLINALSGAELPYKKIKVEVEGYGISQQIITDGEGKAIFSFTLGEKSTKINFKFSGDEKFVESETSDYFDVVSLKNIWWFLSPEVLLLIIVLILIAFFYRWFRSRGGKIDIREMIKDIKEVKNEI